MRRWPPTSCPSRCRKRICCRRSGRSSMGETDGVVGVVIVDDHRMFAESLSRLLSDEEGISILGIAGTGAEAVDLVGRLGPRVVLMDYELPDQDGVSVTLE